MPGAVTPVDIQLFENRLQLENATCMRKGRKMSGNEKLFPPGVELLLAGGQLARSILQRRRSTVHFRLPRCKRRLASFRTAQPAVERLFKCDTGFQIGFDWIQWRPWPSFSMHVCMLVVWCAVLHTCV